MKGSEILHDLGNLTAGLRPGNGLAASREKIPFGRAFHSEHVQAVSWRRQEKLMISRISAPTDLEFRRSVCHTGRRSRTPRVLPHPGSSDESRARVHSGADPFFPPVGERVRTHPG